MALRYLNQASIFPLFQQNKIILDPLTFSEARFRPSLEERLESIISGAALMADSSCTRDDRRERIVAECNAVRQALQDLLSEYMNNVSFVLLELILMLSLILFRKQLLFHTDTNVIFSTAKCADAYWRE